MVTNEVPAVCQQHHSKHHVAALDKVKGEPNAAHEVDFDQWLEAFKASTVAEVEKNFGARMGLIEKHIAVHRTTVAKQNSKVAQLEREQRAVDERLIALEDKLRAVTDPLNERMCVQYLMQESARLARTIGQRDRHAERRARHGGREDGQEVPQIPLCTSESMRECA